MGCSYSGKRNSNVAMELKPGKYVCVVDVYWSQDYLRKFVVSTYGQALTGLAKPLVSQTCIESVQYLAWRDFASHKQPPTDNEKKPVPWFEKPETFNLTDGLNNITVSKASVDLSKNYGIELRRYEIVQGKGAFVAGFTATNVKGYEIISEINEGDRHLVSVGNRQCEVEILKQVSNSEDG